MNLLFTDKGCKDIIGHLCFETLLFDDPTVIYKMLQVNSYLKNYLSSHRYMKLGIVRDFSYLKAFGAEKEILEKMRPYFIDSNHYTIETGEENRMFNSFESCVDYIINTYFIEYPKDASHEVLYPDHVWCWEHEKYKTLIDKHENKKICTECESDGIEIKCHVCKKTNSCFIEWNNLNICFSCCAKKKIIGLRWLYKYQSGWDGINKYQAKEISEEEWAHCRFKTKTELSRMRLEEHEYYYECGQVLNSGDLVVSIYEYHGDTSISYFWIGRSVSNKKRRLN